MADEREFTEAGRERLHEGEAISVDATRFRFADGREVQRDVVHHPGGIAIVAHDERHVLLVRQPRPAVGEPRYLEIPAGRPEEGEEHLEGAKRELAEELGRSAQHWEHLSSFWLSPDVLDLQVHLFLATGLAEVEAEGDEEDPIEVVPWPLERLDEAIASIPDAKTIIALLMLRDRLRGAGG